MLNMRYDGVLVPLTSDLPETRAGYIVGCRLWLAVCLLLCLAIAGCGKKESDKVQQLDPNKPWGGLGSKEAYLEWKAENDKHLAEEKAQRDAAQAKSTPPPQNPKPPAKVPGPAQGSPKLPGNKPAIAGQPGPAPAGADRPPPLPAAPRNVAHWNERDFVVARVRELPSLMAGIQHLGTHCQDDEAVAATLSKLLQPASFAQLADVALREPAKHNPQYAINVITASIEAIAKNRTSAARQVLGQLITGRLATENNLLAAELAITALAAHPSPAHDEMLLRVATEAEQLAAMNSSGPSTDFLRQQALAHLAAKASPDLRTRAARFLLDRDIPEAVRLPLERLLSEPTRTNFDADLVLYLSPHGTFSFRTVIERQLAKYSGEALLDVLGFKSRRIASDSQWTQKVTESLWSPKFGLMVEARLNRVDLWSDEPALLALACSLPTDSMRAAVMRRLEKQWALGPAPFASQQASEVVVEPGDLALLRSVYEERAVEEPARKPPLVSLKYGVRPNDGNWEERKRVQDLWAQVAGDLAAVWCERCRNAALDHDTIERSHGRSTDWITLAKAFPIQPHSAEGLVAAHEVRWKRVSGNQSSGGDDDSISMHYLRLEERARPTRLVAAYRRSWPSLHPREITNGGCLEGIIAENGTDFLRSVDIRITRAAYGTRQPPGEEQELVVEILSVEIRNPVPETRR